MKQRELTEKQKELLKVLVFIFARCKENGIAFVYDNDDCTLSAFNADNVNTFYGGLHGEDDGDELMNWELAEIVDVYTDYFNSGRQNLYLNFEKE